MPIENRTVPAAAVVPRERRRRPMPAFDARMGFSRSTAIESVFPPSHAVRTNWSAAMELPFNRGIPESADAKAGQMISIFQTSAPMPPYQTRLPPPVTPPSGIHGPACPASFYPRAAD